MMTRTRAALVSLFTLSVVACARSSPPLPGDSVAEDGGVTLSPPRLSSAPQGAVASTAEGPIESRLFPPELAMEHQAELGITPEQKTMLITETEHGHSAVLHAQWELEAEKEKLLRVLDPDKVDEAKAQAAAARVMEKETKVKAAYLTMLVRVKNILTTEQKAKLRELRRASGDAKPMNDAGAPRNADAGK